MGRKIYRVEIRIDEEAKAKIDSMCNSSKGLNQSKVIRKAIMDCRIEEIRGKAEIIATLKRTGTNINQIARKLNSSVIDPNIVVECMQRIEECKNELKRIADKY